MEQGTSNSQGARDSSTRRPDSSKAKLPTDERRRIDRVYDVLGEVLTVSHGEFQRLFLPDGLAEGTLDAWTAMVDDYLAWLKTKTEPQQGTKELVFARIAHRRLKNNVLFLATAPWRPLVLEMARSGQGRWFDDGTDSH